MIIIALEGLDKSGKATALRTLKQQYENQDLSVRTMEFPNYASKTGELIRAWLTGTTEMDTQAFELLLAADKQVAQREILEYEASGVDVLIIDRYIHSQLAYGTVDNNEAWLDQITHYLRKPDAVVYMSVSVDASMQRKGKHGDNDKYESDRERLVLVKDAYERMLRSSDKMFVEWVDANHREDVVRTHVEIVGNTLYRKFKQVGRIG